MTTTPRSESIQAAVARVAEWLPDKDVDAETIRLLLSGNVAAAKRRMTGLAKRRIRWVVFARVAQWACGKQDAELDVMFGIKDANDEDETSETTKQAGNPLPPTIGVGRR